MILSSHNKKRKSANDVVKKKVNTLYQRGRCARCASLDIRQTIDLSRLVRPKTRHYAADYNKLSHLPPIKYIVRATLAKLFTISLFEHFLNVCGSVQQFCQTFEHLMSLFIILSTEELSFVLNGNRFTLILLLLVWMEFQLDGYENGGVFQQILILGRWLGKLNLQNLRTVAKYLGIRINVNRFQHQCCRASSYIVVYKDWFLQFCNLIC